MKPAILLLATAGLVLGLFAVATPATAICVGSAVCAETDPSPGYCASKVYSPLVGTHVYQACSYNTGNFCTLAAHPVSGQNVAVGCIDTAYPNCLLAVAVVTSGSVGYTCVVSS